MMKKYPFVLIGTSVGSIVAVSMISMTAFASTDTFTQQYQAKLQQETTLWQQVQSATAAPSSAASATISQLEGTVTTINAQTAILYDSLQTLDTAVTAMPQPDSSQLTELKLLQGRRQEIISANNKAWSNVVYDSRHHQMAALKRDVQQHNYWSGQLTAVDKQIKNLEETYGGIGAPYLGARPSIESSILHLQDAAIHYTEEILQLQGQVSVTTQPSNNGAVNTTTNSSNPASPSDTTNSVNGSSGTTNSVNGSNPPS